MKIIVAKPELLNQARMKNGFSMRKLSRQADIDVVTIHRIETNKTQRVSISTAKKVCDALHVSFDELFEIVDYRKEA